MYRGILEDFWFVRIMEFMFWWELYYGELLCVKDFLVFMYELVNILIGLMLIWFKCYLFL